MSSSPFETARAPGTIVALHLNPGRRSRSVLHAVERVRAIAGFGLEGDERHAGRETGRHVLLVSQTVLDDLGLEPGQIREQVTVRGLDVNALTEGAMLRAGGARLRVAGPCDPCARMDEIRPGLRRLLEGRRGRFVEVVDSGSIALGDALVLEAT